METVTEIRDQNWMSLQSLALISCLPSQYMNGKKQWAVEVKLVEVNHSSGNLRSFLNRGYKINTNSFPNRFTNIIPGVTAI